MKKIFNKICLIAVAGAFAAALLPSCDKWLEATSSSQIPDSKLFSTRSGFHEALTGVYLDMGAMNAYGGLYTWLLNDLISCPYVVQTSEFYRAFQQHRFTTDVADPYIEDMWLAGYNIIANANKTLYELENRRDVVTDETEYRLIRGELLAIRAYVHFDLMRMFGLESWTGENATCMAVPYQTAYSSAPPEQHTYAATAELLLQDVTEALSLLEVDPVRGETPSGFNETVNTDGYWTDRQKHLNYYAAEALAARICLWNTSYSEAARYAADVVDGAFSNGLVRWIDADALVKESNYDKRDWTFSCEHLFSLEVTNLYDNLKPYVFAGTISSSSDGLFLLAESVNQIFLDYPFYGVVPGSEDIRGPACLLSYTANGYVCNKFYSSTGYDRAYRSRMPMIRLSEMYYILAENALRTFDDAGAIRYLDEVRTHRGITSSVGDILDPTSQDVWNRELLQQELFNEYLRECLGEGQFLYCVKRLHAWGMSHFLSPITLLPVSRLEYPYPTAEITYGRIQDK